MKREIIFNKTKIIATVGPACDTKDKLTELVFAGVDVFRLNFSHGTHEKHQEVINTIRAINKEHGTNTCILQDLQGPKIRTGEVGGGGVEIHPGDNLTITTEKIVGNAQKVSTSYQSLASDIEIGDHILIDDGKIELLVEDYNQNDVICRVIHGGFLNSRKGINLPHTNVSAPSLTDKDIEDLALGIANDVEWIALSFVRSAEDVIDIRGRIKAEGKNIKVIAKIEKPEAVKDIDAIIEAADALMVARGDLGVEILMEEVPMVQKMIANKCNNAFKPVIIATQMMESMIENPRPTRAETNDIANAVMDGADTLMLSGETAVGKYPVQVIRSMARTIKAVEDDAEIYFKHRKLDLNSETFFSDNVVLTACRLGRDTKADAIIGMTDSGYTAYRLSGNRPKANIFIFTSNTSLLTTLSLVWGVRGFFYDKFVSTDDTFSDIEGILKQNGCLKKGNILINTASMPIKAKYRTNMLKISVVE